MIPNHDWQNPGYITGPPLVHIASLTVTSKDMSDTPVKHTKDNPGLLSGEHGRIFTLLDFLQTIRRER